MNLVKLSNGKFAIRKGWIWHRYYDLYCGRFWWYKCSIHFSDCQGDEHTVRKTFYLLKSKDEVIE